MTDKQPETRDEAETRAPWVAPQLCRLVAGEADAGVVVSIDGPDFS